MNVKKAVIIGIVISLFIPLGQQVEIMVPLNETGKMKCPTKPCDFQMRCYSPLSSDPESMDCIKCIECEGETVIAKPCDDNTSTICCKKFEKARLNKTTQMYDCVPEGNDTQGDDPQGDDPQGDDPQEDDAETDNLISSSTILVLIPIFILILMFGLACFSNRFPFKGNSNKSFDVENGASAESMQTEREQKQKMLTVRKY